MITGEKIAIRWTIGDVSTRGFEALRLSIWGAWKLFGPEATYVVCFNSISLELAKVRTGDVPKSVLWHESTANQLPQFLKSHLDRDMSEGVSWKFAPLRLFPDRHELVLDNDCILWDVPLAIQDWLEGDKVCVLAEDVRSCFGHFAAHCGEEPRNSGIRGLPPRFDLEGVIRRILEQQPVMLRSELDEQGLQVAALSHETSPLVVTIDEVSICSPFPPHLPSLGRCGAHFVGLNAKQLPWELNGRPAVHYIRAHWHKHRASLFERVGLTLSPVSEM
ncbi:MAG: hypothetical protein JWQ71_3113 [Pedosphaera sp.]|nr:hypothetical protein [Pedosphaera sp.]